jgi:3',5'-cyclic AMP phosphodiesterase CpdA
MRIAHLSDVHVVVPPGGRPLYGLRTRVVNFGRAPDPDERARKLANALAAVKASGADHLVVSGDLTDLGDDAELARFAEILAGARLDADVTLVPGNHDAYSSPDGFARALAGPLAAWAGASARPGEVRLVDRGGVVLVPLDVTRHQALFRSSGELTSDVTDEVLRVTGDPALAERPIVVVMHHPAHHRHAHRLGRWIDSLHGIENVDALLAARPSLHVLHGHFHEALDRGRVFGAPAVSDDTDAPRVRLYDVEGPRLVPRPLV